MNDYWNYMIYTTDGKSCEVKDVYDEKVGEGNVLHLYGYPSNRGDERLCSFPLANVVKYYRKSRG